MRPFLASQLVLITVCVVYLCVWVLEIKIQGMLFSINLGALNYVHLGSHFFVLFSVCEAEHA